MSTSLKQGQGAGGFTLTELLITIAIVGVLAAMAIVSWLGFLNARYLATAQDELFQAMRQTQIQALRTHMNWQTSVRETSQVQWAVHPATALSSELVWQSLMSGVHIDRVETTLLPSNNLYRVEFDHRGHILPPFGRLTLSIAQGGPLRRCVFTSTALGTIRKAKNRDRPDSTGRYCY